jgi:excisionase family DNA binding protein
MKQSGNNVDQLWLTIFTQVPQGDGTILLRPQKPTQKVPVAQAARILGVSIHSVYRSIDEGHLIAERPRPRKILVLVESLQQYQQRTRDPEFWSTAAI